MKVNVTLCDINGNPIPQQKCSCGNDGVTFFQGKDSYILKCNNCLFPDVPSSKYYAEWGGNIDVIHEEKRRNMADLLNEEEMKRITKDV